MEAHPPVRDSAYAVETYDEAYYRSVLRNERYRSHRWRLKWVDYCLDPRPGERIVDLGCGPGLLAKHLASRGAIVHGVDLSPLAVEFARRHNAAYPNCTFAVADASCCRHLPDCSFDKACSVDVTEHCGYETMCGIFAEAHRLLKPGGLYFIYTPNPRHWIEVCRRHHFILKPFPGHTGLRNAEVIIDALHRNGFEIVRHIRPPSMIPVVQWLEKLWSLQPLLPELGVYRIVLLAAKRGG